MYRWIFSVAMVWLFAFSARAQQAPYFQQHVNYTIHGTLNDSTHELSGNILIEYTNNSPDELYEIYLHLWPNAYSSKSSKYARESVKKGSTRFYYSKPEERGGLDSIAFKVNGQSADYQEVENQPDVAIIRFLRPIEPGETIKIETPYLLKIPKSFSRLGHVDQTYQMTQWYIKPAVYDKYGWHPMPYTDQGEFYSEFGNFDVYLTLPENYVVGATGTLQTASEVAFLADNNNATRALISEGFGTDLTIPPSSKRMKTLHYHAENVHDFAWFADKRYHVLKDTGTLPSGKTFDVYAYFTNEDAALWKNATDYLIRAVKFYSDYVGEYPYPHASAAQSTGSHGGGMEYPMITLIGSENNAFFLDLVITHEVGHNWFYGILATNERDAPWMDEGFNTYIDDAYMRKYYPNYMQDMGVIPKFISKSFDDFEGLTYNTLGIWVTHRKNTQQPSGLHSHDYTNTNYGVDVYFKTSMALRQMMQSLPESKRKSILRKYFEEWQFKHPYPEDFSRVVYQVADQPESWFFDGVIYGRSWQDYAIKNIGKIEKDSIRVLIKNNGTLPGPFPIRAQVNDTTKTQWIPGFVGKKTIHIPATSPKYVAIDPSLETIDLYTQNNYSNRQFPMLRFLPGMEKFNRKGFYVLPALGFNSYDGFLLGLTVFSEPFLMRRFEFSVSPMYGFRAKSGLEGTGWAEYHFTPNNDNSWLRMLDLGIEARSFHFNKSSTFGTQNNSWNLRYERWRPYLRLNFQPKNPSNRFTHKMELSSTIVTEESPNYDLNSFAGLESDTWSYTTLSWSGRKKHGLYPFGTTIKLENSFYKDPFDNQQQYTKLGLRHTQYFRYGPRGYFRTRAYVGVFLDNSRRESTTYFNQLTRGSLSLYQGSRQDYGYNDLNVGRSDYQGLGTQQVFTQDAGMRIPQLNSTIGQSNSFIGSFSIEADLPFSLPIPIRPYFQFGTYENSTQDLKVIHTAGLHIPLLRENISVYLPFYFSKDNDINNDLNNAVRERGKYYSWIMLEVKWKNLRPHNWVDQLF